MIDHEQLAAALQRLDARERELLHLSLCRRVPDGDLAEVFDCEAADVARRRASAIDRLGDDLGVQRGEDLGQMLKALLEPETWEALETADVGTDDSDREPTEAEASAAPSAPETAVAAPPGNGAGAAQPVLEMLAGPAEPQRPRTSSGAALWIVAGTFGAAALVAAAGFAGATWFGNHQSSSPHATDSSTRHFTARGSGPLGAPFPSYAYAPAGYLTATLRSTTVLYRRPGGRRLLRIAPRTEWKSPRVLSVVAFRGRWLGVTASELANGQVGWLPVRRAQLGRVSWSLKADLSKRALFVRRHGRTVRRMTIAIGAAAHPTPTGRFAVTDRLEVVDKGSPYGCCVLALSGHQRRLPPTWPGGDRLAIHATSDTASIGKPVSLGCMRATASEARWLIENVPLGTPVFIRN